MSDEPPTDDELQSVEKIAAFDAYLDNLIAGQRPDRRDLTDEEQAAYMLAAQLRLARDEVEAPAPDFLDRLEQQVAGAVEQAPARKPRLSRGGFLRTVAGLAGGVGLGVAGVEGVAVIRDAGRPHDLVAAGDGRWYDVAAVDEVQAGGAKPFTAGGVLGYLLNDGGTLHAVSAICTHMGCKLKPNAPEGESAGLHCLCHGSRFSRKGAVERGMAPTSLPTIEVRVENGRVYALGTRETV